MWIQSMATFQRQTALNIRSIFITFKWNLTVWGYPYWDYEKNSKSTCKKMLHKFIHIPSSIMNSHLLKPQECSAIQKVEWPIILLLKLFQLVTRAPTHHVLNTTKPAVYNCSILSSESTTMHCFPWMSELFW